MTILKHYSTINFAGGERQLERVASKILKCMLALSVTLGGKGNKIMTLSSMSETQRNHMKYARRVHKEKNGGLIFHLHRFNPATMTKTMTELDHGDDSEWHCWEKGFNVNFYNKKEQLDRDPLKDNFENKTFYHYQEKEKKDETMRNTNDPQKDEVQAYDSFNLDESMNWESECAVHHIAGA